MFPQLFPRVVCLLSLCSARRTGARSHLRKMPKRGNLCAMVRKGLNGLLSRVERVLKKVPLPYLIKIGTVSTPLA